MKTIPLRHLAEINPPSGFFEALPAEADVLFLPLETVWADGRADQTRRVRKSSVESGYTRFHPGDTVCPKVTPTFQAGRSMRANAVGAGTTELHVLRPRVGVDPRWVTYAVRSKHFLEEGVTAFQGVAGLQRVPQEFVANFHVADVPMGEQRRIADFLDDRVTRIDQIITARQAQLAAARELYEAQRDNLLSKTEVKVRELRRLRCLVQTGPFGSQLHSDEYVDNGWPVVNPAGISGGGIRAISGMAVDDDVRDRLSRHILRLGDIVFGRRGEMGRAGLVTQSEVGWVCGTGSLLVRLTDPAAEPAYITELLSTMEVRRYFQRQSVGSTMDNLNTEILLAVPLRIPSVQQQRATLAEIAGLAENAEEARRLLDGSISTLAEYKQSLITAAVTGGCDVTTAGSAVRG